MRYLGVDLGDVRTGIAVSDETNFLASGIGYIKESYHPKLAEKILEYVQKYSITVIVLGNPINMNGTKGASSEKAAAFAELLRSVCGEGTEVVLFDERRTTMSAHTFLNMCNVRGKKRKETVDTLSASIILQDYLDAHRKS